MLRRGARLGTPLRARNCSGAQHSARVDQRRAHALPRRGGEAARFAAQSRLRPILMTAISSLTGFLPLMLASGAGAQSQSSLGLVVFGGLLVATFLSTLVVPVFYVVMKTLLGQADAKPASDPQLN